MANVVVTIKIMPESPEVSLSNLKDQIVEKIKNFAGEGDTKVEEESIGFGLSALNIMFILDENKSNTKPLEEDISNIEGVGSVEVTDVRRAIG